MRVIRLGHPHRYGHRLVVTVPPMSTFPLDMLRYDCCWPSSQSDVQMLVDLMGARVGVAVNVTVQRTSPARGPAPWAFERWHSFGVQVRNADE